LIKDNKIKIQIWSLNQQMQAPATL